MEAAVRSAYYLVTGKNPDADFFTDVRGLDGWKEAVADIDGTKVRVAVAHGLGNAVRLLDAIRDGRASYDFVEVMACPGGCVGGGGQPIHDGCELAAERGQVLWDLDAKAGHSLLARESRCPGVLPRVLGRAALAAGRGAAAYRPSHLVDAQ